jgi:tRNA 2-thiouridine synthesizing protein A
MQQVKSRLDARGISSPLPILRTRKAIAAPASGEVLEVTVPDSVQDIGACCEQTGHALLGADERNGACVFFDPQGLRP